MPTRREWERREKQRRGSNNTALPEELAGAEAAEAAAVEGEPSADTETAAETVSPVPPLDPGPDGNPAHSQDPKDAYTGRPDQEIRKTTGPGAGGATEWGGGNKNHPSRIAGKPPGT